MAAGPGAGLVYPVEHPLDGRWQHRCDFRRMGQGTPPQTKIEVIKWSDDLMGYKVLPHRWVVECTFG